MNVDQILDEVDAATAAPLMSSAEAVAFLERIATAIGNRIDAITNAVDTVTPDDDLR